MTKITRKMVGEDKVEESEEEEEEKAVEGEGRDENRKESTR